MKRFVQEKDQIIFHTQSSICTSKPELLQSNVFDRILTLYLERLQRRDSLVLSRLPGSLSGGEGKDRLVRLLLHLCDLPLETISRDWPERDALLEPQGRRALHEFVEGLYDFWRTFDRFMVLHSEPGPSSFDRRPYRAFNATAEALTHLIRSIYRDVCESITGDHPRVYRQISAGCEVGLIAISKNPRLPEAYQAKVEGIPFIRQVWMVPPMIIDPPMNKRTGEFVRVDRNPMEAIPVAKEEWLCYPAQVGPLVVFVYFHQHFFGLGCALANLFELATDEQIHAGPDAVYFFGVPPKSLEGLGKHETVFFDDEANRLLVAAVPVEDRFGYFGYLKKMILTLHNVAMMKRGRMPFHGAMVHILLKNGRSANILIIGDTATGKSETLEAFRTLGNETIRDMRIIADDMGSLEQDAEGRVLAFGTEIGAFVRLDDLQEGYAFSQIDRAVLMSPHKTNARVVLPITTIDEVLHGYPIDVMLYANNYEAVDEDHPILDRLPSVESALRVFHDGAAMSKGTTTASGLVHTYFANPFGPNQYKTRHEELAAGIFQAAFARNMWVGQMRTRLGIAGCEAQGPREAAQALLDLLSSPT